MFMEFHLLLNSAARFAIKDYHEGVVILKKKVGFIISHILLISSIKYLGDWKQNCNREASWIMPYYTDGYLGILVMIYLDIQKSLYRNKSVITCNTGYIAITINNSIVLNLCNELANQRKKKSSKEPSKRTKSNNLAKNWVKSIVK